MFNSAEAFRSHVYKEHNLKGSVQLAQECWRSKVGRNGQGSFWCGFCKDVLLLQERALAAWEERFRHIEAHYRAGQSIDTWLCAFTNKSKWQSLFKVLRNSNLRHSTSESVTLNIAFVPKHHFRTGRESLTQVKG